MWIKTHCYADYLMWRRDDYGYPHILSYKYFTDKNNDKKAQDRVGRQRS